MRFILGAALIYDHSMHDIIRALELRGLIEPNKNTQTETQNIYICKKRINLSLSRYALIHGV